MREAFVERMKDAVIGAYIELSQPRITPDNAIFKRNLPGGKREAGIILTFIIDLIPVEKVSRAITVITFVQVIQQ